ncbi:MAG: magnesium transporter [Clostridia bacterium]|nr:magnesium transporter [Clostridia bacterium]
MENRIIELLEAKDFAQIKEEISDMNAADAAAFLEELFEERTNEKELIILFRLMPKDLAADCFSFLDSDTQRHLIDFFSDIELQEVLDQTFIDDAVDMIEEMPANVVSRILRNSDAQTRAAINEILKYPRDSAGSIMTIEYVDLLRDMTVDEAFTRIRRTGVDKETIYTCYVKDENRHLIGMISVKTLLLSEKTDLIEDIMETNLISVNTHEDREVVAGIFEKYDFLALPVVDAEYRLVGIVTIDDVIDVIQEEVTEDIEKMAAIVPSDKPYMKTGVIETCKKRIPWLLLLMISATFTGKIIGHYESALASYMVLSTFIPMLMDTGGNAGGQASVTIIRSLSLGDVEFSDILSVLWKELRVGLSCGIILCAANFVKLLVIDRVTMHVAAVVCGTLIVTVMFAKVVGCLLPMLAKKLHFDPAVMASPFITTIVDAVSLVIYFRIAKMLLGI